MFGDIISLGAVVIEPSLDRTFRSPDMRPIFDEYSQDAYASIGYDRDKHLNAAASLEEGFAQFHNWLASLGDERHTLVSDNPAFDWQWINFGFHYTLGKNPLGFSARRIGDMWAGMRNRENDARSWKKYRKTRHTHDPLDDALGNAEAYLKIWNIK
jgi:hypothetical protein